MALPHFLNSSRSTSGPLSLMKINEELHERSSGSGLGNRRADHAKHLYLQKLALKFAQQRRSSVGIVRLNIKCHGMFVVTITS
jgi:hypothetical protein